MERSVSNGNSTRLIELVEFNSPLSRHLYRRGTSRQSSGFASSSHLTLQATSGLGRTSSIELQWPRGARRRGAALHETWTIDCTDHAIIGAMVPISDNAFNAASHPAKTKAARSRFRRTHWDAIADLIGETAPACMSFRAVGIEYAKVIILSRSAMIAAASHHCFKELPKFQAAAMLANVSRVSGTVVTNAQNLRPVSVRRIASPSTRHPFSEERLNHCGTTILCSKIPAPNATPRLMTNIHSKMLLKLIEFCLRPH